MMAAKKNKFTQICFLKLENMEAGSGIRANLAYILFKTLAQMNNGMFNESKNAMSVMIKSIDDTHEDAIRTDNECVACIDYAGYYSKQELDNYLRHKKSGLYQYRRELSSYCNLFFI